MPQRHSREKTFKRRKPYLLPSEGLPRAFGRHRCSLLLLSLGCSSSKRLEETTHPIWKINLENASQPQNTPRTDEIRWRAGTCASRVFYTRYDFSSSFQISILHQDKSSNLNVFPGSSSRLKLLDSRQKERTNLRTPSKLVLYRSVSRSLARSCFAKNLYRGDSPPHPHTPCG